MQSDEHDPPAHAAREQVCAQQLPAIEGRRIIGLKEAARLRNVSVDTLKRRSREGFGPQIIVLSSRRRGCRLSDVLADPQPRTLATEPVPKGNREVESDPQSLFD